MKDIENKDYELVESTANVAAVNAFGMFTNYIDRNGGQSVRPVCPRQ